MARSSQQPLLDPLHRQVIKRLDSAERFRARRRIFQFSLLQAAALALLVAGFLYLAEEASETGFTGYLSLAFSDTSTVSAHLSDFSSLLIESLPILSLTLIGLGLAGLLVAFRGLANSGRVYPLDLWQKFW